MLVICGQNGGETIIRSTIIDHRTVGPILLARFDDLGVPGALEGPLAAFEEAHEGFEAAAAEADEARAKRDEALAAIGEADAALDESIGPLCDRLVGAGLGTRTKPFGDASPHSPTALKKLPYKTEVQAVRALVEALRAKSPPADVMKALDRCAKAAKASEAALEALTAPQAAFDRALGARDALLPEWSRTFSRLQAHAKAAWHDDPATFASVFAPPERVQRPVRKRKAKKDEPPPADK